MDKAPSKPPVIVTEAPPPAERAGVRDDVAYVLPMGVFLLLTMMGGWWPDYYPHTYVAKALIVPVLLTAMWRHYTPIRWNHWWLGVIVGVIGIFQWIGMQLGLQAALPDLFAPAEDAFNPRTWFESPAAMWAFISIRLASATLLVPVMEELFWRDFAWRTILAPNNFKLARIGEWHWQPFFIVAIIFSFVHGNWWATSIVWALMIHALLVYTRSIGACIIAHGVTNLLLGLYVLYRGFYTDSPQWWFW